MVLTTDSNTVKYEGMKTNNKIIIGIISLIGIAFIGVKLINTAKRRKVLEDVYLRDKNTMFGEFPLRFGSRGDNVIKLQEYLNKVMPTPLARLDVDGIFGDLTQNALKTVTGKESITENELKNIL